MTLKPKSKPEYLSPLELKTAQKFTTYFQNLKHLKPYNLPPVPALIWAFRKFKQEPPSDGIL